MNTARIVVLFVLSACALGCGGSATRNEGPITSPWTVADDEALGMTPASTAGGEAARE